jgi:hypothetical protein
MVFDDLLQLPMNSDGADQSNTDGRLERAHRNGPGGSESCGYPSSLRHRNRVEHIHNRTETTERKRLRVCPETFLQPAKPSDHESD